MAKQRYISDKFWSDSWVELLNPTEKLLYIYLFTNSNVSICGFYEITLRKISFDTGISTVEINKILQKFEQEGKVFFDKNILCIVNFVKNQTVKSENDNLWKGIVREIKNIGLDKLSCLLKNKGLIRGLQGAYKTLPIPYLTLLNLTLPNLTKPKLTESVSSELEEIVENEEIISTQEECISGLKLVEFWNKIKEIDNEWKGVKIVDGKIFSETIRKKAKSVVKKYTEEQIKIGIKKYLAEIDSRKGKDGYVKHRFTFLQFFGQSNGFDQFYNLT